MRDNSNQYMPKETDTVTNGKDIAVANDSSITNKPSNIMEDTLLRIQELLQKDGLHVPAGYSASNAVRGAWLKLQTVKDKSKQPALQVCTKTSIAYALFHMVVMGLDAQKKQCDFLVYGNELTTQISYFGNLALAKRADKTIDKIIAMPVFKDDDFEVSVVDGGHRITKHVQTMDSMNSKEVVGAYATAIDKDGKVRYCNVMTIFRIHKSWGMSKARPFDDNGNLKSSSVHAKFPDEMAMRTVYNHLCKIIINSSTDNHLVKAMETSEQSTAIAESNDVIGELENGEVIDIDDSGEIMESKSIGEHEAGF